MYLTDKTPLCPMCACCTPPPAPGYCCDCCSASYFEARPEVEQGSL